MTDISQSPRMSETPFSHDAVMRNAKASPKDYQVPRNYYSLPTELRLMIIHKTFTPRTVSLEIGGTDSPRILCRTPNPITLYINRESRIETLRYYKQIYASYTKSNVYFNPQIDSLLANPQTGNRDFPSNISRASIQLGLLWRFDPASTGLVQSITIQKATWSAPLNLACNQLRQGQTMFRFLNLREVVLIIDGDKAGRGDWEYDLLRDEGMKQCVSDLTAHFMAASKGTESEAVGYKVPEIIFRDSYNDVVGR